MRLLIYNFLTRSYFLIISIAALFHAKARLFVKGRTHLLDRIKKAMEDNQSQIAWFHCASLGEFEQARPVLERFRKTYPGYRIFLTFFSPSGYEIRKNYEGADFIFYLPNDSARNVRKFLDIVSPAIALFVKYEFWYYYLNELRRRKIPAISFSAIFRKDQLFFKPYGKFYKNILMLFDQIFVQDENSNQLLIEAGLKRVETAGDTRFDRVTEVCANPRQIVIAEKFKDNRLTLVAGSVWPADMQALTPLINDENNALKHIIAPHNIHESEIAEAEKNISKKTVRFSKATQEDISEYDVLIIDNIGMLSSLYQYGDIAYIGGAFGKGLHNTLEAAAYGIPVLFGRSNGNTRFKEAVEMVKNGAAFEVSDADQLKQIVSRLVNNQSEREISGGIAASYVKENKGATDRIMGYIKKTINE